MTPTSVGVQEVCGDCGFAPEGLAPGDAAVAARSFALIGLVTPARPLPDAHTARELAAQLPADPSPRDVRQVGFLTRESVSVAERLQAQLHPWSSFVVLPLFSLANAGIPLHAGALADAVSLPIGLGVAAGLALGAPAGVIAASWMTARLGLGDLPRNVTFQHLLGVAGLAGIGFTMSLFITDLTFGTGTDADHAHAHAAILVGSTSAAIAASVWLRLAGSPGSTQRRPSPDARRPNQSPTDTTTTIEVIEDARVPARH